MDKESRKYSVHLHDLKELLDKIAKIPDTIDSCGKKLKISETETYKDLYDLINKYLGTENPYEVNQVIPKKAFGKISKLEKKIENYVNHKDSGSGIYEKAKRIKLYEIKNALVNLKADIDLSIQKSDVKMLNKTNKNDSRKRFLFSNIFKFSGEFMELVTAYIGLSIDIWQAKMGQALFITLCIISAVLFLISFVIDVLPGNEINAIGEDTALKRNWSFYLSFLCLFAYIILYYGIGVRNLLLSILLGAGTVFAVVFVCTFAVKKVSVGTWKKKLGWLFAVGVSLAFLGLSAGIVTVNVLGENYSINVNEGRIESVSDLFVLHSDTLKIDVYNGEKITDIDNNAFEGKKNLKTVYIGGSVHSIGANAFRNCINLETVYIYFDQNELDSVTISPFAFNGCDKLKIISIDRSEIDFDASSLPRQTTAETEKELQIIMPSLVKIYSYGTVEDTEYLKFKNTLSTHKHTVKYVVDGTEYQNVTQEYMSAIDLPENLTKTGYTFINWGDADGNLITIPETIPAYDMVFYAKWEVNRYNLVFNVDGANYVNTTQEYGATLQCPSNPTKTGYIFNGWADADGNLITVPETIPAYDMVFYAKWEAKKSIVRFVANGGTVPFSEIQVEYGKYTELPTPYYNSAHNFEGWYTDKYFYYKYNDLLQNITQDTTLYAKWSDVILNVCNSTIRTGNAKINGSGHYTENSFSLSQSVDTLKSNGYKYLHVTIYCPIAQQDYCRQYYYVYNNGKTIYSDQTYHSGSWYTYTFDFDIELDRISSRNFTFRCQAESALFRDFWIGTVNVVITAKP